MKNRCKWCSNDSLYISYHDKEWGIEVHNDRLLFEFLSLEGAQAGLSWITILKKRKNYKKAFDNFNIKKIVNYNEKDIERLLSDAGIVRNRLKINSVIKNAKGAIKIIEEFGSLDSYFWSYVDGNSIQNEFKTMEEIPAKTEISQKMSSDLKKRGFNFVGPTICYAFMQAIGMVNDHTTDCFKYEEVKKQASSSK